MSYCGGVKKMSDDQIPDSRPTPVVFVDYQVLIEDIPDSTPTPVIGMGYRDLRERFLMIAGRLDKYSILIGKNCTRLIDSERCKNISKDLKNLAERVNRWPWLDDKALAQEKNDKAEKDLLNTMRNIALQR